MYREKNEKGRKADHSIDGAANEQCQAETDFSNRPTTTRTEKKNPQKVFK